MHQALYLVVFSLCAVVAVRQALAQEPPPPPPPPETPSLAANKFPYSLKRVVRQMPGPPPPPPEMNPMSSELSSETLHEEKIERKRRHAKGVGGSMPTRKG